MTTRDIFGLGVRLLGLYLLWTTTAMILGMIFGPLSFGFWALIWHALLILLGLWLLRGAPQIVDYAYPPEGESGPYNPGYGGSSSYTSASTAASTSAAPGASAPPPRIGHEPGTTQAD
ncbi:MAG: hypothetical protein P8N09_09615 [Planctomycetota bacterium]|nr:hypothetical protein [Planctomycetota bacterium]